MPDMERYERSEQRRVESFDEAEDGAEYEAEVNEPQCCVYAYYYFIIIIIIALQHAHTS